MTSEIWKKYRLDYLLYIAVIALLDVASLWNPFPYFSLIPIALAWLSMVWEALQDLKEKHIGTEFFLVFATIIALIGKQEHAIMIVLLIMVIAHYIESLIENRTQKALEELMKLVPDQALIMENDKERVAPLSELMPGMVVIVKTGGRIPADGIVSYGLAYVNEAALTGESVPKEKKIHDQVFAGTFVESGSIIIKVQYVQEETIFGKMTELFKQAAQKKARITVLTEKMVFVATPLLIIFIAAMWFITHDAELVITLLIFGSPLELALVAPLTMLSASVAGFRHGILIKGGRVLEQCAYADTIIFDKTGTLTLGEPSIVDILAIDPLYTAQDILFISAIAEKRADHVIAKSILKKAQELALEIPQPDFYTSIIGRGVEISYKGQQYYLGNKDFIESSDYAQSIVPQEYATMTDKSIFYLAIKNNLIGAIVVSDIIRPDAQKTIESLKTMGITNIILLSGDRQQITTQIAEQLGITRAVGEVLPAQKLHILQDVQQQGHIVAMVGDGINDAAALKAAHVGIALGAMGMAPAIEAADIVLMTNELQNIVFVRKLSQKAIKVIKENLIIGFFITHMLGLILTLTHLVTPIQAAFFHAISDILILINSSKLITFSIDKGSDI